MTDFWITGDNVSKRMWPAYMTFKDFLCLQYLEHAKDFAQNSAIDRSNFEDQDCFPFTIIPDRFNCNSICRSVGKTFLEEMSGTVASGTFGDLLVSENLNVDDYERGARGMWKYKYYLNPIQSTLELKRDLQKGSGNDTEAQLNRNMGKVVHFQREEIITNGTLIVSAHLKKMGKLRNSLVKKETGCNEKSVLPQENCADANLNDEAAHPLYEDSSLQDFYEKESRSEAMNVLQDMSGLASSSSAAEGQDWEKVTANTAGASPITSSSGYESDYMYSRKLEAPVDREKEEFHANNKSLDTEGSESHQTENKASLGLPGNRKPPNSRLHSHGLMKGTKGKDRKLTRVKKKMHKIVSEIKAQDIGSESTNLPVNKNEEVFSKGDDSDTHKNVRTYQICKECCKMSHGSCVTKRKSHKLGKFDRVRRKGEREKQEHPVATCHGSTISHRSGVAKGKDFDVIMKDLLYNLPVVSKSGKKSSARVRSCDSELSTLNDKAAKGMMASKDRNDGGEHIYETIPGEEDFYENLIPMVDQKGPPELPRRDYVLHGQSTKVREKIARDSTVFCQNLKPSVRLKNGGCSHEMKIKYESYLGSVSQRAERRTLKTGRHGIKQDRCGIKTERDGVKTDRHSMKADNVKVDRYIVKASKHSSSKQPSEDVKYKVGVSCKAQDEMMQSNDHHTVPGKHLSLVDKSSAITNNLLATYPWFFNNHNVKYVKDPHASFV